MFWKFNNPSLTQFETILAKQDVTLKEVMDAEELLNECKAQNRQLIEFLMRPEILLELVTLTTTEPTTDVDERTRFKYANIACEMITCDIPSLNERLAGNEALLAKLYAFLDREPPLNPLLASFFSKIMAVLIAKKTEQNWLSNQFTCIQVLDFLKAKDNFVSLLLNHISTSAIMDLTLKLMTQVEGVEARQNILNYLDSQRIIQSLVALLDPQVDGTMHNNVAQLLCDFIQLARDNQRNARERYDPDPLLNALESPDTVALLLDHILGEEKCETAIVGGINVLLELFDRNKVFIPNLPYGYEEPKYDKECKPRVIESTSGEVLKRLGDIHNLLIDPPKKDPILTTMGTLDPPLGNTRLQVARLLATLIAVGGPAMSNELISLGTMGILIDLFFAFPWNNFLHTQVQACIEAALDLYEHPDHKDIALSKHLLVNCKLVERILEAWKDNDEKCSNGALGDPRRGYMGHLINIANRLNQTCTRSALGKILQDNLPETAAAFKEFNEDILRSVLIEQDSYLGDIYPYTANEDNDEYGDLPFTSSGQQIYDDFQNQQLSLTNCYGSFGTYNDDDFEFKPGDDMLQTIESRPRVNFELSENDLSQQQELFKQMCSQTINTLDDCDEKILEEADNKFETVIEKQYERNRRSNSEDGDDQLMDDEIWNRPTEASETPIIMTEDPWANENTTNANANSVSSGWADFSMAVFDTKIENSDGDKSKEGKLETDLKVENVDAIPNNLEVVSSDSKEETEEVCTSPLNATAESDGKAEENVANATSVQNHEKVPSVTETPISDAASLTKEVGNAWVPIG